MHPKPEDILPALEKLLACGGDSRIVHDPQGINKYGCPSVPQPEVLSYSSSTASIISSSGFTAAARLYRYLKDASRTESAAMTYAREINRVRSELITLCDLTSVHGLEVVFGASGTDLHLLTARLLCEKDTSLLVIMPDASETGSGVRAALEGRHFSAQTALGVRTIPGEAIAGTGNVEVASVHSRFPEGDLRPDADVDAEVAALVTGAVASGRHVLLTLTDVSKTGLIIPSPACALALRQRFPMQVDILVDACQFRLANATLRAYLAQDFLIAMTGSKFVTGPAFCGALLIPRNVARRLSSRPLPAALSAYSSRADWPQGWAARTSLNDTPNYGLLLRFEAALSQLRAFRSLSSPLVQSFLDAVAVAVKKRLADDPVFEPLTLREIHRQPLTGNETWDHLPTIFPFLLRHKTSGAFFSRDETFRIYELMQKDLSYHPDIPSGMRHVARQRCMLGQPVAYGTQDAISATALRLNIDMRLIGAALSEEGAGPASVIAQTLSVLEKTAVVAKCLFD